MSCLVSECQCTCGSWDPATKINQSNNPGILCTSPTHPGTNTGWGREGGEGGRGGREGGEGGREGREGGRGEGGREREREGKEKGYTSQFNKTINKYEF